MLKTRKDVGNMLMKRTFLKQGFLVSVAVLGIAAAIPVVAQAIPAHAEEAQTSAQERQATTQTNTEERREAVQTRLADAKLRSCQNREKAITNIMARLSDRGQKQVDLFSTIAERTEKFYADKGKTLANYDALVADVAAKKTAAQATVDNVKSTSVEFTCGGDNPKGVASTFKDNLKTEIGALKAYKASVKNLIVGVKSVQGTTSSAENGGAN
jgi:iron-sulfur cluster repair protein YtfE (RIC family)